jgi:uncharacterized protein YbjT (DUF2867 family)
MSARTAILAGATGLVGRNCLDSLLTSSVYERVTVVVRRPLAVTHTKLEQLIVDFESLGALDAAGADVFSALGTTIRKAGSQEAFRRVDLEYTVMVARLASEAGARQFVLVSSVGANARSRNFYLRVKGETEDGVSALPFQAVHVFRPSFLVGKRAEPRPGEGAGIAAVSALSFLFAGPLKRYRPIEAVKVARAMVRSSIEGRPGCHVYHWPEIMALAW